MYIKLLQIQYQEINLNLFFHFEVIYENCHKLTLKGYPHLWKYLFYATKNMGIVFKNIVVNLVKFGHVVNNPQEDLLLRQRFVWPNSNQCNRLNHHSFCNSRYWIRLWLSRFLWFYKFQWLCANEEGSLLPRLGNQCTQLHQWELVNIQLRWKWQTIFCNTCYNQ